jgi:adenosylcobinamide-GDP ribazoletransferase
MRRFLQALGLLTRLPVSVRWEPDLAWGRLAGWFAPVGFLLGGLVFGLAYVWMLWPATRCQPLLGAALMVTCGAALTGALHLDGWGDCCDAFFVPADREKRLAIMADPRIGSFGTVGLVLLLLVKTAAVNGLLLQAGAVVANPGAWPLMQALWPLVAAPTLARALVVLTLAWPRNQLARPGGMGARVRDGLAGRHVAAAALAAMLVLVPCGWYGCALAAAAGIVGIGFVRLAHARIGGVTGDVLGGLIELVETSVMLAACLASLRFGG